MGYNEFTLSSYDLSLFGIEYQPAGVLLALLSIVVVVSLQIVGIILVVAILITPAAASSLIAKRFSSAILLGIFFGVASGVIGLYISYYFNLPSGPSIALTATAIFTLCFLYYRLRIT